MQLVFQQFNQMYCEKLIFFSFVCLYLHSSDPQTRQSSSAGNVRTQTPIRDKGQSPPYDFANANALSGTIEATDKGTLGGMLGVVPNERLCVVSAATDPSPEELLRQLQEERTCKVCMDKLVSIVFIPCGHLVVCGDCAASLRHCPICRAVIRGSVRAFMS